MFFGDSGSIAGGTMPTPPPSRPAGTYCSHVPDAWRRTPRSAAAAAPSCSGFGVERSMWQRQIQCLARSGAFWRIAGRLGVVDDDHVPVALQALGVHRVVARRTPPTAASVSVCSSPWSELCISFVTLKNSSRPEDHLPVRVEPDVAHQRHERVEDLRDAAAERGRADVQDPLALQGLRQLADLVDEPAADEVGVVGERPLAEGYLLEHPQLPAAHGASCRRPSRSIPASSAATIAACSSALAAATQDIWNSGPEPSSGRSPSGCARRRR